MDRGSVVINEFEVIPEAPRTTQEQRTPAREAVNQAEIRREVELVLRDEWRLARRVRAY